MCRGQAQTGAMTTPFTDDEVALIRAVTPGCTDELVHLNHAGSSLPPQVVLDTQIEHLRREASRWRIRGGARRGR